MMQSDPGDEQPVAWILLDQNGKQVGPEFDDYDMASHIADCMYEVHGYRPDIATVTK